MTSGRTSVLVCRGCCCGTASKHPDVDHTAHLDTLRSALPSGRSTKLWTVDCLGPCDHSNVIVVRTGATRRWFGDMLADDDIETLAAWIADGAADPPPTALRRREFTVSHEPAVIPVRELNLATPQLCDLTEHGLRSGGTWTMGVHGAVAEFNANGASVAVHRDRCLVEAGTASGAIRLHIDSGTRVFLIDSADPDRSGPLMFATIDPPTSPRHAITELGPDDDAFHSKDRCGVLFDLGLGRSAASFCVRAVGDTIDLLRAECGNNWRDVNDRLAPVLLERSPHRVVLASRGRTEITSPIAAPGTTSPVGSHTHLLPGELELGRDLPPGLTLPTGFQLAAVFLPPPGWTVPTP